MGPPRTCKGIKTEHIFGFYFIYFFFLFLSCLSNSPTSLLGLNLAYFEEQPLPTCSTLFPVFYGLPPPIPVWVSVRPMPHRHLG